MLVIFDATVFCADFQMNGNAFRVFLGGHKRVGLAPAIPQSIIDEVTNRYNEECAGIAAKAEKLNRESRRVLGKYIAQPFSEEILRLMGNAYSSTFLLFLMNNDFDQVPYPEIAHKDLAKRAIQRKRPFRDSGVGYRDALIWAAIRERLAKKPEPVCFVTANTMDFWAAKGLHPDLMADLQAKGLSADHVRLFHTLEELNNQLIIPTLQRLDDMKEKIEKGTLEFSLKKWLSENIKNILWDDEELGPFERGHGECRVSSLKEIRKIEIDAVRQVKPGEVLIALTAELEVELSLSADWENYEKYEDVKNFYESLGLTPSSSLSLIYPIDVKVSFTIIMDEKNLSVLSYDTDWFESEFGELEINPHPTDKKPENH